MNLATKELTPIENIGLTLDLVNFRAASPWKTGFLIATSTQIVFLDLATNKATLISKDNWNPCRALLPYNGKIVAICNGIYTVEENGQYAKLGTSSGWHESKGSVQVGDYAYVISNFLYKISLKEGSYEKVSADNWNTCKTLVINNNRMLAFCKSVYEIFPEGKYTAV